MPVRTFRAKTAAEAEAFMQHVRGRKMVLRKEDDKSILICGSEKEIADACGSAPVKCDEIACKPCHTYRKISPLTQIKPHTEVIPATSRAWFYATELPTIYAFPTPDADGSRVIGVVSFGGGLVGSLDANGVLTNGDCQAYWTLCGINSANHPTVVVKPILGATNDLTDEGSTAENTLDVQTIGACCPTAKTTIILYIVPNNTSNFGPVINYMLNTPVVVKDVSVKPSVFSISWGLPEVYMSSTDLTTANAAFYNAISQGVSITVATGDNGANDGVGGTGKYTDFPSSSPNVVAVGGTNLFCPNRVYDGSTVETAWSSGGGGISSVFNKPAYQGSIVGTKRNTPDVASVADPNTGVLFIVYGQMVVYGGTSVAAPTIAGWLACVNKNVWINPLFYSAPTSYYHDILVGNNGGYVAKTGYDNTTGLGSLKGDQLLTLFSSRVIAVSLNATTISLGTGKTYTATATVLPAEAVNKSVTWSSSNAAVATVNSSGVITGVKQGSAILTATTVDGGLKASLAVSVFTSVTGLIVSPATVRLRRNGRTNVRASVQPPNASNKTVAWSSSNTNVATVTNGTVLGRTAGTAIITATTADGGFTGSCTVTVV